MGPLPSRYEPDCMWTKKSSEIFKNLAKSTFVSHPCAGGIYFKDLPANMLGSFAIGLFAASSTVGLANEKELALLPSSHPWQNNLNLQIGIRTGFCGCLTTFSSWMLELMTVAIQNNQWVNAAVGFIVGLYSAIGSYMVGIHVALYVDRWLLPDSEDVLMEEERFRAREIEVYRSGSSGDGEPEAALNGGNQLGQLSPQQEALEELEMDLPRLRGDNLGTKPHSPTSKEARKGHETFKSLLEIETPTFRMKMTKTDLLIAMLAVLLTSGAVLGVVFQKQHYWLRTIWLSLLFAPAGCLLRWQLARLNYALRFFHGTISWFPSGTFAANMLGTALTSGLQSIIVRSPNLSTWGTVATTAAQTGFCGSLSTVSTFVTEIVKFLDVFPDSLHAYWYVLSSFATAIALVFALFSWSVWS